MPDSLEELLILRFLMKPSNPGKTTDKGNLSGTLRSFIFEFVQKGSNQGCTWVENPGDGVAQIFTKIPK
jgi:hypothetical protein